MSKPTLKLLLTRIEDWCNDHLMVTEFGHGLLPDMEKGEKRTDWTLVYLVVQDPNILKHGIEFAFDFIVVAPTQANPDSTQADQDSVKQVQSDLLQIIQDFVAEVRYGDSYFYKDGNPIFEFPEDFSVRALPFLEDHAQWVTGFNAQISLLSVDPLDQCAIPYSGEFEPPVAGPCDVANILHTDGTAFTTVASGADWNLPGLVVKDQLGDTYADIGTQTATYTGGKFEIVIDMSAYLTEAVLLDTCRQFTKGQGATIVALTDGATAIDLCAANMWSLTLAENTVLGAPSNDMPTSGVIFCQQDATGGFTMTFNAAWKVVGDTVPTAALAKFSINIYSDGAGRLVANILDESV